MADALALLLLIGCAYALLSPRIPTGILGSAGLCAVSMACIASLDVWARPLSMMHLMMLGAVLCLAHAIMLAWRRTP